MTASYKICGVYLLQKKLAFTLQQGGRRTSDGLCKLRGVGVAQTFKPVAQELPRYWGLPGRTLRTCVAKCSWLQWAFVVRSSAKCNM
eukprot:2029865-Amphidinium_carterae.1